jgi:hypothetical protein
MFQYTMPYRKLHHGACLKASLQLPDHPTTFHTNSEPGRHPPVVATIWTWETSEEQVELNINGQLQLTDADILLGYIRTNISQCNMGSTSCQKNQPSKNNI